jgi:hypothetical protein
MQEVIVSRQEVVMPARSNLLGPAMVLFSALIAGPALAADLVLVRASFIGSGLPTLVIVGGIYGAIWLARKVRVPGRTD